MSYRVKEIFYSLQGEGAHQGRAAVFCRFSRCNLWNGREKDRATAICNFCDTDFNGTDGQNGGIFDSAEALAQKVASFWPTPHEGTPWLVCTGGEPLLQLDSDLVDAFHREGFEVAIETNGTLPLPRGIDWVCLSPKGRADIVLTHCDELKLVYPQTEAPPERFASIQTSFRYLSPMADPHWIAGEDAHKQTNTAKAVAYCLAHPQWRLSLQVHKLLGID
ncbi:MAG: 7-carboxy-7-deazaguanine synthase [Hahellaceae bacterium]|nr:7-carboxy-7-deazaguanine synthase [Hahellaceae bacterium]